MTTATTTGMSMRMSTGMLMSMRIERQESECVAGGVWAVVTALVR